jgi:nucleoside-diphosphate-sugar epimerase
MREGCEVHQGDLRILDEARQATQGCTHVIHLAAIVGGIGNFHKLPHTLTEVNNALYNGVVRAALDHDVERFVYVSSSMVFERATEYPTTEAHIIDTPIPASAYGFSKLTGEVYVKAAHEGTTLRSQSPETAVCPVVGRVARRPWPSSPSAVTRPTSSVS